MNINEWWSADPAERFWMEITGHPGDDLLCPQLGGTGKPVWTYSLITRLRPGDVVLHWDRGRSALVGWSTVTGEATTVPGHSWQARGSYGQERGQATVGDGWTVPCGDLVELDQPVDGRRLRALAEAIWEVEDRLRKRVGKALYFPFSRYRSDVRAFQGYLTKFPLALVRVIPELSGLLVAPEPSGAGSCRRGASGTGRVLDVELRKAIEGHAVRAAKAHYLRLGAERVEEVGKPFDLRVFGLGDGELRVEVKGSSTPVTAVELTSNEVQHAREHATELFVVGAIEVRAREDGGYDTSGGQARVWRDWEPHDEHLTPTRFRYVLPDGGGFPV